MNPQECVWVIRYRIIMKTILQEKVKIHPALQFGSQVYSCASSFEISCSESSGGQGMGKNWRKISAWNLTKVKSEKQVIDGQGDGVPKACWLQAAADSRGSLTCVCASTFSLVGWHTQGEKDEWTSCRGTVQSAWQKPPVRRKGGRAGLSARVSGRHVVRGRQSSPILEVRPGNGQYSGEMCGSSPWTRPSAPGWKVHDPTAMQQPVDSVAGSHVFVSANTGGSDRVVFFSWFFYIGDAGNTPLVDDGTPPGRDHSRYPRECRLKTLAVLHPGVPVMWHTRIGDLSPTAEAVRGGRFTKVTSCLGSSCAQPSFFTLFSFVNVSCLINRESGKTKEEVLMGLLWCLSVIYFVDPDDVDRYTSHVFFLIHLAHVITVRISLHPHPIHDVICLSVRLLSLRVCLSLFSLPPLPFLSHSLLVLCPAHHLQCCHRRGLKTTALTQNWGVLHRGDIQSSILTTKIAKKLKNARRKWGNTCGSSHAVQKESSDEHHEGGCEAGNCIPKDSKHDSSL